MLRAEQCGPAFSVGLPVSLDRWKMLPKTQAMREDDRLVAEWVETCRESSVLKSELEQPTVSRLYRAQVKFRTVMISARDKCKALFLAIRAHRKATRNGSL